MSPRAVSASAGSKRQQAVITDPPAIGQYTLYNVNVKHRDSNGATNTGISDRQTDRRMADGQRQTL